MSRLARARIIRASLGIRVAAGFCRNSGLSLEAALWFLLRKEIRCLHVSH